MSIFQTSNVQCRDCYKCVRACVLKAIKINNGQAEIIEAECIEDGLCTLVCPQQAKEIINEWPILQSWLNQQQQVIVSLDPSYLGLKQDPYQFLAVLSACGISRIEEASWVIPEISAHYWQAEHLSPVLTSACPAIVNLIEIHYPMLIDHLAPVVSPMILHSRSIKQRYPYAKTVFIGPCPTKKQEQTRFRDDVDLTLTFREVAAGLKTMEMHQKQLEAQLPDISGTTTARHFPMSGGWRRSWSGSTRLGKLWVVNGFNEVVEFLDALRDGKLKGQWAELMICKGGCLGGAGWNDDDLVYERQSRLMSRIQTHKRSTRPSWKSIALQRSFTAHPHTEQEVTEQEIMEVLANSGKQSPKDQLDCGACGYNSCREKAIAVIKGKAEIEMCIPYMRVKAESFSSSIIEASPNGTIVVDDQFKIVEINPAAIQIFKIGDNQYLGENLSKLINPLNFELAKQTNKLQINNVSYPEYGCVTRQYIYPIPEQNIFVGIFTNITNEVKQTKELARLKEETLDRANEVIEKQMRVAQEIASLLGETTAETKILLSRVIKLIEEDMEVD